MPSLTICMACRRHCSAALFGVGDGDQAGASEAAQESLAMPNPRKGGLTHEGLQKLC